MCLLQIFPKSSTLTFGRMVPQCGRHHICLPLVLAGGYPGWRLGMDHYHNDGLFDILSHLE